MTISNVMQAVLYAFTTVTSVSALAVALFGSAAAIERWLDGARPNPTRPPVLPVPHNPDASVFGVGATSGAA